MRPLKHRVASAAAVIAILLVGGCSASTRAPAAGGSYDTTISLFDAERAIDDGWLHMRLRGETEYRLAAVDGTVAIRAIGRESASGLVREVHVDPRRCPTIEWVWRVDLLQPDADLRRKEKEDVAASIFLMFGDPGSLTDPHPVPTLRYVWTNSKATEGEVIDNPYLPGTVRSLVVRAGDTGSHTWTTERRNLSDDFELAFGTPPPGPVEAIVLFTDNDQTKEPVEAYYAWARAVCAGPR
jgi:hypothetical protein